MSEETKTNDDEEALEETTLLSHLIELRSRLLKIALAVVLVFIEIEFYFENTPVDEPSEENHTKD